MNHNLYICIKTDKIQLSNTQHTYIIENEVWELYPSKFQYVTIPVYCLTYTKNNNRSIVITKNQFELLFQPLVLHNLNILIEDDN